VVVDGDRKLLLRALLSDDVLVQELLDLLRCGERRARASVLEAVVVCDDVVADFDAFITNEDRGPRDELTDIVLVLVAEGAAQDLGFPGFFHHAVALALTVQPVAREPRPSCE